MWLLHTVERAEARIACGQVAAGEVDAAVEETAPDGEEFISLVVAFVVVQQQAVAGEFVRQSAGDDVQQQATVANAVECGRLPCGECGRQDAWPQGEQELQGLRRGRERGTERPTVEAVVSCRQQNAAEAKSIGCSCDLAQVPEVGGAMAEG